MAVDGIGAVAGAGGASVSAQDEYRYELLQRLRRRALERRRDGDGAPGRSAGGAGGDGDDAVRRRRSGARG